VGIHFFWWDKVEGMDTGLSSSWEIMVGEAPLGGVRIHYEIDVSNLDKELVTFKNPKLLPFYSQLVTMSPSLARWKEV